MLRYIMLAVFVLGVTVSVEAQTYAVGETVAAGDTWPVTVRPDTVVTTDQVILIDFSGSGIGHLEAVSDGSAKIYLYQLTTGGVVQRRYGPILLEDYYGARSLVPVPMGVKAIEAVDVSGDLTLHGRP